MNIQEKLISSIRHHSPYIKWAESGLTPHDVKARILAILQPYFDNPSVLTDLPIEVLAHEAVSVGNISGDPWARSMLVGVLREYRGSVIQDQQQSIAAFEAWNEAIARATSEFFSIYVMEVDKTGLSLEEVRLEVLRNIGGLLEACIQPHLKALLHQVRIRRRRQVSAGGLIGLKFGETVEELYQTLAVPGMVAPPPWNLKLHVWRNIAQHHSATVHNERISCCYRIGKSKHRVDLTRDQFITVARKMQQMLGIVRTARAIFFWDNEGKFQPACTSELRQEISFFEFALGIATQGFTIRAMYESGDVGHLQVQDVTNGDARSRGIHASQFLVAAWLHFRTPVIQVTYADRLGRVCLVADATGSDCDDIAEERVPFENLASRVRFTVV
jgi:hypothetical protein